MAEDEFRAAHRIFEERVIGGRDWSAVEEIYSADARILPPGAPMVQGREGIAAFWRQAVEEMGLTGGRLHTLQLERQGDSAWEIGRAELTLRDAPGPVEVKYVVLWRRENGAWRCHADIWNTSA